MKNAGIYKIENKINHKLYIGSSSNMNVRWKVHINNLQKGIHINPKLQNAFNKYGKLNFSFNCLESCNDINLLLEREQYYINTLKPEYNINLIAGKPPTHSKEFITKLKNKKIAQYSLDGDLIKTYISVKIASKNFNGLPSISKAARGLIKTAAGFQWRYYKDIPLNRVDPCLDQKTRNSLNRRKPVAQYSLTGKLINVFESQLHASLKTGISNFDISDVVRDKRSKTAGGYQWKFWNNMIPVYNIPPIEDKYIRMVKTIGKNVICWNEKERGVILHEFPSFKAAARFVEGCAPSIKNAINMKRKYRNLFWSYK